MRQATDGDDKTMHFHRENTDFETNRAHEVMCLIEEGHKQRTTHTLDVMLRLGPALMYHSRRLLMRVLEEGTRNALYVYIKAISRLRRRITADAKEPCGHKTLMTSHFVVRHSLVLYCGI